MIILIGSEKGGTGKTTIATNIAAMRAAESKSVLLLDTDIQGSAMYWSRIREQTGIDPPVSFDQKYGRIDQTVTSFSEKYSDIVIDAGGRDSEELRSAMLIADAAYVPMQASQFDIWTINTILAMLQKAIVLNPKLRAYILLNRVSTHPAVTEAEDAVALLKNIEGAKLSEAIIRDRIIFRKAVREGRAVTEIKNMDQRAAAEIQTLYEEIYHG